MDEGEITDYRKKELNKSIVKAETNKQEYIFDVFGLFYLFN